MKRDPQERVQEPFVEQARLAAEVVASAAAVSVGGCEVRPENESKGYPRGPQIVFELSFQRQFLE